MPAFVPEVTFRLLASGILDLADAERPDATVRQDRSMPPRLRRALALLSGHSLEERRPDLGACVHEVMALATRPAAEWGLAAFRQPFPFADAVLVDGDLGVPTDDCVEIGREGSETEILQSLQHERLRAAVSSVPAASRKRTYTEIRSFVVRNPVVAIADLKRFCAARISLARTVEGFYHDIPIAAVWPDGTARTCAGCGSLLWPDPDRVSYPEGRCRIRQCLEARPTPVTRDVLTASRQYAVADNSVLAYWVGPGLDEIRIHDALRAVGVPVVLYPDEDAADVGTEDLALGIDAKAYSSPIVLAARLTQGVGRLEKFKERYIAVPDAKLRTNPDYLRQLRSHYAGRVPDLRFRTVSDTIEEVIRSRGDPS